MYNDNRNGAPADNGLESERIMYGYIKQHDEKEQQDIIYLMDTEVFKRMHKALKLHADLAFIEVTDAELIGGVTYKFTMENGTDFLMAGDAFISIILMPKKAEEEAPDEKHAAIITILTPLKERGDPAETLVAVGESAGYLAREVVEVIFEEWPEILESYFEAKVLSCWACKFPMPSRSDCCPACGSIDHLTDKQIEESFKDNWTDGEPDPVNDMKKLIETDENLPEAIMRIANLITEPFQRGDILQALKKEKSWEHLDLNLIAKEMYNLIDEAQLYFDPKDGFRVTVRDEPEKEKMCIMCGKLPATVNNALCKHCAMSDCECEGCTGEKPEIPKNCPGCGVKFTSDDHPIVDSCPYCKAPFTPEPSEETVGVSLECSNCHGVGHYPSNEKAHEDGWYYDAEEDKWACYECEFREEKNNGTPQAQENWKEIETEPTDAEEYIQEGKTQEELSTQLAHDDLLDETEKAKKQSLSDMADQF